MKTHAALEHIEQRLAGLTQAGAAAWDEPGVQLVRRLLDAAAGADAELCAHLAERAGRNLDRLAQGFAGRRARAEARLRKHVERDGPDARRWRAKLEARAAARGITSPGTLESPSAELLAATLYRDAVAGANASLVLARAAASIPEDAGHYNPVRVASRALEALSHHPAYLRAQLARLEVLALLQELKTAGNGGRPQRRPRERKRA